MKISDMRIGDVMAKIKRRGLGKMASQNQQKVQRQKERHLEDNTKSEVSVTKQAKSSKV